MNLPEETAPRTGQDWVLAAAKAVCLVGFPLVPMLVYLSKRHPGLGGLTAGDQINRLAQAAERWAEVHFAFSVGGFLAIAAVLILRREVARKAPELWTNAAAAVGVVGGVIFTGTVLMEVQVIPALSVACAESPPCTSPANGRFAAELADQGWRVLPGLGLGGRTLMVGVALLAVLGVLYGGLRNWEGGALFFGAVLEIGNDTGLHAWGNFRLANGMPGMAAVAILVGGAGIAWRLLKGLPSEPALAPAGDPAVRQSGDGSPDQRAPGSTSPPVAGADAEPAEDPAEEKMRTEPVAGTEPAQAPSGSGSGSGS